MRLSTLISEKQQPASGFAVLARLIALALAGVAVAACTATDLTSALEPIPSAAKKAPASNGRFGDVKPIDFGRNNPNRYPIHGIDVSKWQGDIDWAKVRRSGVAFAFVKATEGGDHIDDRFQDYWRGARAAGIAHAPYHFYYFCTPAAQQADWYIANVPRDSVRMPPVLDMEWNHASRTCSKRPDPETVRSEMKIWMDRVERHFGKRPIIYTTVDFHRQNLNGYFQDYQFWLRSVAAHPGEIYPDHPWSFWQYTGTGIIPGVEGKTDINVYAGSTEQWREWLRTHAR